jgi:hypothetical protein
MANDRLLRIIVGCVAASAAAFGLACTPPAPCANPASPSCAPQTSSSVPGTSLSGCFGWPATDFSPSNKAAVQTSLRAGDRAAEFSLRDTAGAAVTLAGLLATRPVLLVHGAFT